MTNLAVIRTDVFICRQTSLRVIENRAKTIDFHLLDWFRKTYENYCKNLSRKDKKKILALKSVAYDFYLDYYLTNTKGTIDIHEALYRKRITLCSFAANMAEMQVMKVVKEGRLENCYKALQKMLKERKAAIKKCF